MNPNKSQIQHHRGFFLSELMEVVHAAASVNSYKRSSTKKLFPYVMIRCPGYKSSNVVISSQSTSVLLQIHVMFISTKIPFVFLELLAFIVLAQSLPWDISNIFRDSSYDGKYQCFICFVLKKPGPVLYPHTLAHPEQLLCSLSRGTCKYLRCSIYCIILCNNNKILSQSKNVQNWLMSSLKAQTESYLLFNFQYESKHQSNKNCIFQNIIVLFYCGIGGMFMSWWYILLLYMPWLNLKIRKILAWTSYWYVWELRRISVPPNFICSGHPWLVASPILPPATLKELVSQTMIRWAQENQIQDAELVRIMFNLLRRQYDSIGELLQALRKTYTISQASVSDTINLLAALGQIRSLLSVRMGKEEELLMINGLG